MAKLDKHFKCPKSLKISMIGQTKDLRHTMYEAHQSLIDFKKKTPKRDKSDSSSNTGLL
jgi:hypothetical protein